MSFFDSLNITASALTAQKLRMDVISENIANVDTTRTAAGGPYKRKAVIFQERPNSMFTDALDGEIGKIQQGKGVRVSQVVEDETPGALVYDPSHPDANADGYVRKPNVNIVEEMVNMISASRSYEANITAMTTAKTMTAKTLEIGK